ncbi:MAG: hypothetical protein ABIA04_05680 [Pseudomonadota bacterium]
MASAYKDVFTIIEKGEGEKSFWVKVGAAFTNRDDSLTIYLDALPTNGRLQVRERSFKKREDGGKMV